MSENKLELNIGYRDDDILNNLGRCQILRLELEILLDQIYRDLDTKKKEYNSTKRAEQIQEINLLEDITQVRINLLVKNFMFVFRQFIARYFRALFQAKSELGYDNVSDSLPDLSIDNGVKKKIIKLIKKEYQFDPDILDQIIRGGDFLILSRIIRNSIKKYAVLKCFATFENDTPNLRIVCPLDNNMKDETLAYIKEKHIMLEGLENFTIKIGFLENCLKYATILETILVEKLRTKGFFNDYKDINK